MRIESIEVLASDKFPVDTSDGLIGKDRLQRPALHLFRLIQTRQLNQSRREIR